MQGAQAASCPPLVITTCRPLPPLGLTRLSRALLPPRAHHAGAAPLCSRHGPPEAMVAAGPGVLRHTHRAQQSAHDAKFSTWIAAGTTPHMGSDVLNTTYLNTS
jgi:hypothetical protein